MTETYKKIMESITSGELIEMAKSEDVSERLVAQGISLSLNLYSAIQDTIAQELEDARTD
jgi:hypothetical protein